MIEPSVDVLGGDALGRVIKRYVLATRPMFFTASVLPVIVGTVWGVGAAGQIDAGAMVLALAAILCVHGGINVLNDVYDSQSGGDETNTGRIFPFTGGSRFIQNGVMSAEAMKHWGMVLLIVAAVLGLWLFAIKGWVVLALGVTGMGLGVLYSMPPVALGGRGIGEAAVGAGFGVLPVIGAAWLQSGTWDGAALILSLAVGFWIAAVLVINEVPDIEADAAVGKRTLVARLGIAGTRWLYLALQVSAVVMLAWLFVGGGLSALALSLPVLGLAAAMVAAQGIAAGGRASGRLRRGIRITLAIHGLGCLWLALWL